MNNFGFLVLFGLLALGTAKPEGYSYQRPQILPQPAILHQQSQPLQLSHGHQTLPVLNQPSGQGYSYQQPQPQVHVQQPQLHVQVQQPQPQFNVQVQQPQPQFNVQQPQLHVQVQQAQPQLTVHQPQPQFNVQLPEPQPQFNVQIPVPQGNLNNFQSSLQQSLPQIQIQPQVQFSQVEQNSGSFQNNALPQDNVGQNLLVNSQQESSGQNNFADVSNQQPSSLVTKHISIHVAPEDPEEVTQIHSQPLPVRKNYKIIFIKAPTVGLSRTQIIAQQAAQVQEKTLVYVLVNKPHESELVLPAPAPAPVSKPEVYFIKYKSNSNGNAGPALVDGGSLGGDSSSGPTGAGLPIVEDIARGQGQGQGQVLVNSGESSSSLFSGGLSGPSGPSPQYGVPGYQKRSPQK